MEKNKETYKNFIMNKNPRKSIVYTQTPAGTLVKTVYEDDQKSRISLKSRFSNNELKRKNSIKTKIIEKITKNESRPESINSNNEEFDRMVEIINSNDYENNEIDNSGNSLKKENEVIINNNGEIINSDVSNNINNVNNENINSINSRNEVIINIENYSTSSSSSGDFYNDEIGEIIDIIDTSENYKNNKYINLLKKSILKKRAIIEEDDECSMHSYQLNSEILKEIEPEKKERTTITASSSSFSFKTPEIPVDPKDLECCYKICNKCCCKNIIDKISNCKVFSRQKTGDLVILIDKDMMNMLHYSLSSSIISNFKYIRYSIPLLSNIIIFMSALVSYMHPEYLNNDSFSWSIYFSVMLICYNYLFYLVTHWNIQKHYEERNIQSSKRKISFSFYYLFTVFFIYYSVYYYYYNYNKNNYKFMNYVFHLGMYLFFTTCGACYYFVTTKLIQKGNLIHKWLHELKLRKPPLNDFYDQYNKHYKKIKFFAKYWNILIFLGFIMLTFNFPLDLISIFYYKEYYNIGSIIFKSILLGWYTYCICYYNFYQRYIPSYLYKHRIFNQYAIKGIEKYMTYRPVALNFYGFTINGHLIMKSLVLIFNFVLPTLYGLISNRILQINKN